MPWHWSTPTRGAFVSVAAVNAGGKIQEPDADGGLTCTGEPLADQNGLDNCKFLLMLSWPADFTQRCSASDRATEKGQPDAV